MDVRVLVAYASRHNGAAEIAEKIGQVLRSAGLLVDVLPAHGIRSVAEYQAVVLGSGVYAGRWLKAAADFLAVNEEELAKRPLWLFSSGPTGEGDPTELLQGWRFPRGLQPIADRVNPRDITVFHGTLDPDRLGLLERLMIRAVRAPTGDYRDWITIAAWAEGIASQLLEPS